MAELPLPVVDGLKLDPSLRALLRPGELLKERDGTLRRLPRYFYEVPSWEVALETRLAPNFEVWEFLNVDVREHERLRSDWPRYLPCAVSLLAAFLELLRREVDTYVHISANGGYRSPAHRLSTHASAHCWGTAANIYRVGDDWLDGERTVRRYTRVVEKLMTGVYVRPWGKGIGEADDHLHLDLGWTVVIPHGTTGEPERRGDDVMDPVPDEERDVTDTAEVGA
jgi:hypothetical protein